MMSKLSLLDKLKIFFEVSKSTSWILIVIIILLGIGFIFFKSNKKNEEISKIVYRVFALIVLALMIITYHAPLNNLFDYMMNNLFIVIYFPNIAIYFAAIIATNIILWISLFNYKTSENIKRLNIIIYLIMNYLLVLIFSVINKNKLDIFSQESIYKNRNATALIELSSIIFVLWIIFLIIYKVILIYLKKDYKPKVKKVLVQKEVKKLPENFKSIDIPSYVYGNIPTKVKVEVDEKEEKLKQVYEDMLTLDDYKQILEILKKKKRKIRTKKVIEEKEKPNDLKLEKLKIELLKQQEKEREDTRFTELDNLYRSIR